MLPTRPTSNWLESNSPSLHQTQDGSVSSQVVVGTKTTYSGDIRTGETYVSDQSSRSKSPPPSSAVGNG